MNNPCLSLGSACKSRAGEKDFHLGLWAQGAEEQEVVCEKRWEESNKRIQQHISRPLPMLQQESKVQGVNAPPYSQQALSKDGSS